MNKILVLSALLFSTANLSSLFAQCQPLSAWVCVSGDDTTQVWVNGSYVGYSEYCNKQLGCDGSHRCLPVPVKLFQGSDFCLAVETTNVNPVRVFSSWEMEVDCQGAPPFIVNDLNNSQISLYWDPTGGNTCGQGHPPPADADGHHWTDLSYHPASNPFTLPAVMVTARDLGPILPLKSALTHGLLPFVSYDEDGSGSGSDKGCGILYWRQVASLPPLIPTDTPTPSATPTFTLSPQPTPTATNTFTPLPTFTPWPILPPLPSAPPRPAFVPVLISRPTPTPVPPIVFTLLQPTPVPFLRPAPRLRPRRIRVKPTPTWVWRPTLTDTPWPIRKPAANNAVPTPAKIAPALLSLLDREQTIRFSDSPANIYVTFADGPGWYLLQIVDGQANFIKTIYDHHVVAESDAWVGWDGRDEKGADMPPGQYFLLIYRDKRALKSLSVIRVP